MKRLLSRLLIAVVAAPLVFSGLAGAQNFWRVEMSDPTTTDQLRSFNIEFTALSVNSSDEITVTLVENNQAISSVTTPGGGGSGEFNVTVGQDGVFAYRLDATNSGDPGAGVRSSATRNVRVVTPEDDVTVIEVGPDLTPEEEAALIDAGTPGAPATDTEAVGEVTDEAAVTDEGEDGETLGVDDEEEDGEVLGVDDEEAIGWLGGSLLALAILAALWYVFHRRRNADV